MADSRTQLIAEEWVRSVWLPGRFGQAFHPRALRLKPGGLFNFDAVSADGKIVVNISTSSGITAGGRYPSAKVQKLRADMLFLLMVDVEQRLILLTEKDMLDLCQKEKASGRVPDEIEFLYAGLPEELAAALGQARRVASDEVSPGRSSGATL